MTEDTTKTDRYVTTPFLTRRLGVTDRTIRAWRSSPELNFPAPLCINGKYLYLLSEVLSWEQANRAAPPQKSVA